jgi:hypothetical protein
MREAWILAAKTLSETPTTATPRCFQLPTRHLLSKIIQEDKYPQWAYVVTDEVQVHYLVDAHKRLVWIFGVKSLVIRESACDN